MFTLCMVFIIILIISILVLCTFLFIVVSGIHSEMSLHDVHVMLDCQLLKLSRPWEGTLIFDLYPISVAHHKTHIEEILQRKPKIIDICNFIGGKQPEFEKPFFLLLHTHLHSMANGLINISHGLI